MRAYNLEQAIRIDVYDKTPEFYYIWKKGWKFLFWSKKPGFYFLWDDKPFSKEQLVEEGYIVEDDIVYDKPHVLITFGKDMEAKLVFDDYPSALKRYNELLKTFPNRLDI